MRPCIVVETCITPGQTFVNRHVEHLFGGAVCVIADRLTPNVPRDGRFLALDDVPATTMGWLKKPMAQMIGYARHGSGNIPWGRARRAAIDFLNQHQPDVILAEFGPQGVALAPIANAVGIPMFCYFRGSDASSRLRHQHVQRAYRLMMPRLAGVFAVSQFLLDNLAAVGVTHPNAHVIPSGVDVRRFVPGEKRPGSVLGIGRFVEKKHPLLTIRAFAEASRDHPQAHLTMIGDGELYEPARALVAELGLAEKVSLPGALPHEQVRAHLERAEIYAQHSVTAGNGNTEGLPTSIQEAMAAGCLIVSTDHAGIPEAVTPGETGFLVPEHDAAGYTDALARALAMPPRDRAAMSMAARDTAVARFDNAALLVRLETAISDTLKRG
ncbi:glycosyl transferase family 1 [Salipiger aestuarii]|uniref:glycosyltransferase n=1 Tax=Salipiger aestuarii TaxID=568098 RepID=UPI00025B7E2A|nr:glycosyltransferase [Salipiger aestuarii]EIE50672.1 glycosyl transferase, group 1 [Citreicella sp. 357]KAA8607322.1 glycosyl transferase family 1 [Salipiger aestuarii]KAA8612985.1 glycosyl transferase family 1 [Salipiger aestuarii]